MEHRKLIMKIAATSTSTEKLNFSSALSGVRWHRVSFGIFQRGQSTALTIYQLEVIGCIVQYLSVAGGAEINFIDLGTEFN